MQDPPKLQLLFLVGQMQRVSGPEAAVLLTFRVSMYSFAAHDDNVHLGTAW